MNEIGIYIHIPYCRVACPYCDFVKKATRGNAPRAFVDALLREIAAFEGPKHATSVFFGGGTPSLLTSDDFAHVMDALRTRFELDGPEVSIEVNPDDVTEAQCTAWSAAGVNRVNVGVQSFDDRVLRFLGRNHTAETARRACTMVLDHFEVWGIDLIFGGRPIDPWQATLDETVALNPPHVSTYGLTYEENTPFWNRRADAIDEDLSLDLYRTGMNALSGYAQYEVSNFARNPYQCRHNQIYWRNEDYAGFGPGAYSFLNNMRARNLPDIEAYIASPGEKAESLQLTLHEVQVETLIQHFRTREGISKKYYQTRFGTDMWDDFGPSLDRLVARGLLREDADTVAPTRTGFELNNEIGLELVGEQ